LKRISGTALVESTGRRRLLFVSNGYGEDSIAAEIIRRLPADVVAEAYPTIGEGLAYRTVCAVVGPRAQLASEGWRNVRGSLARDLVSGGLRTIAPGLRFGRRVRGHYDRVVVVGDLVGVAGCLALGVSGIVYLDVYKTGYGRLYSAPERWLIRRTAAVSFCRSERLAGVLREEGVDARFVGNVMMDTISYGDYDAASRRTRPMAVTLLPGSRQFTAESFALQVEALRLLPPELRPDVFLAAAGGISLDALARGAAGNLIEASDLVLSQAGTATIQALGLGRPVVTFVNRRDRRSRVRDENALFGDARITVEPDPQTIAATLRRLLDDPGERSRLAAIGRERIGGRGAIEAILAAI